MNATRAFTYSSGRPGVWAAQPIAIGETIDESPAIVFPAIQGRFLAQTSLNPLLEEWPNGEIALAFGSAGLYRRSAGAGSNARVEARPHDTALAIIATRDIDQGAEIIVELRPPSKALQRRRLWSSSFVAGAWRIGRNIRDRAQTKEAREPLPTRR